MKENSSRKVSEIRNDFTFLTEFFLQELITDIRTMLPRTAPKTIKNACISQVLSKCACIIHDEGLSTGSEIPVSQKHSHAPQAVPTRRTRLHVSAVVAAIGLAIVLAPLLTVFFTLEANVEITTSALRSTKLSSNYREVTVDVILYNPWRSRRVTVWAEVTCQPTQTSYSKGQYVQIGFRESKKVTFDFTLDNTIDYGEITHRAWVTYIERD